MSRICDALELLTSQHDEISALLSRVAVTQRSAQGSDLLTQLADALTVHLAVEQELFYPALAGVMSPGVHAELIAAHGEIKRILADLLWLEHDDERLAHKLTALTVLFEDHAAWQERDLFEACAESHSTERLAVLGTEITAWLDDHAISLPIAA